ncbi:hypothetical protein SAMN05421738_12212 [Algoriella xinjiangensis]|uniref:Uncharacterized protein n=1 Tax=Algoriella xinjiangensis TaxID=684065 RepID=A0A1I5B6I9_9FLAO|nr:hypothetical protein [Algoriella xinjiangensis]SFN70312.1 hypothetical protein SAMN05421738_12212 [Algoriella xinjiangensis]
MVQFSMLIFYLGQDWKQMFIIFIFIFSSCKEETCESARNRENEYYFNIISPSSYKDNFIQGPYFEDIQSIPM